MYTPQDHTFVICAYQESPYLEDCIRSLTAQTLPSSIIMVTSTPSSALEKLTTRYHIPYYINTTDKHGIAGDWNFGVSKTTSSLITIAHQDDVYKPTYTEEMLHALNRKTSALGRKPCVPLLYFTDYHELRDGKEVSSNSLLAIKRALLSPLRIRLFAASRWWRMRILGMGNPICCPSVTLIRSVLTSLGRDEFFNADFGSNLDWQTWAMIARVSGAFVYNPLPLMCHRIHGGSETSRLIENHARDKEDFEMLAQFWPRPVARVLHAVYKRGQKSNQS